MFISNQKKSSRPSTPQKLEGNSHLCWNKGKPTRIYLERGFKKKRLKQKKIKHGRPGCSLCHPDFRFSHRVDDHLSALPGEKQWFLLAWASTQKSDISHDTSSGKKKVHLRSYVVVVKHTKSDVATADLVNQDAKLSCLMSHNRNMRICWFLIKCWQSLSALLDQCMCGFWYHSLN